MDNKEIAKVDPSIHMDYNRNTVTFMIEISQDLIFDGGPIEKAFKEMQGNKHPLSKQLEIMTSMFKAMEV